jgi:hypothetical protein
MTEEEREDGLDEEFEYIPYQYSMTSYGADYTIDGLVKRIQQGDIFVPKFQRSFVWSYYQSSRFIESLLLGLPVPGIFLSREYGTEKLLVIDGQQRLRTLQFFYEGKFVPTGQDFLLKGVQPEFEGKSYAALRDEDRRRLDNAVMHATIVKQDKPEEDNSSIYYIFERLNTGGTLLTPQEIRSSIFQGEFNDLLKKLNLYETWRRIYGRVNPRMKDEELILRFLALFYHEAQYARPMKLFLNRFIGKNRHLQYQTDGEICRVFFSTVDTVFKAVGSNAFKLERGVMGGIFDSVAVGVARRLNKGEVHNYDVLSNKYSQLLRNEDFHVAATESTSDEKNVHRRIELATNAFNDVP